jgi:signal transduction histidine kinase
MYISLNKKILYSLFVFTVFLILVFFAIFINFYSQKMQDSRNSVYMRNQYIVELLTENIHLQSTIADIVRDHPEISKNKYYNLGSGKIDVAQRELTNERKLNEELRKNYNSNQEAIIVGAKIVVISLVIVLLLILLLIVSLDRWVINPLNRLINISNDVSSGIFSSRLPIPQKRLFQDEFDILNKTFNQMLESIENNIEENKMREQFLQQLIDAIPDGIRVIDINHNVVMANAAFYKLLKLKTSCIGQKCHAAYGYKCDVCPQSHYNCPIQYIQKTTDSFHAIHEVGKTPLYVNAAKLVFGKKANDYYIIEALHDLSQDVLFSHQQKVSSLAFLSTSLAHEMKNNLGAINLIMEGILSSDKASPQITGEYKKYLDMAHKQLVEAIQIPERLLKLAQYSDKEVTSVDVSSAIKDMILMVDYDAKRRGIESAYEVEKNLSFSGNESDFKMIILNLLQNALKAMPEGGKLKIVGKREQNNVVITVSDTGIGIEPDKLKRIFEPFYSANGKAKSSGLGLAIVNSLVAKAKGKITVKSEVGEGTEFKIKIPADSKKQRKKSQ